MTFNFETPHVIVDLETTGVNAKSDRITEIAIIDITGGRLDEWSTLINPGVPISSFITSLTGIDDKKVKKAPSFTSIADEVLARLGGKTVIAHNAPFDYGFLREEFGRAGIKYEAETFCTLKISRRLYPQYSQHNLDSIIARHRIVLESRHRALDDARAVYLFLKAIQKDHPDLTEY